MGAERVDCGTPDHEWVRCTNCPTAGPCACAGTFCCSRERRELVADLRAADE
jgi:hypothetical protein